MCHETPTSPATASVRTLAPPFPDATIKDAAGAFQVDPVEPSERVFCQQGNVFLNCLRTSEAQRRYLAIRRPGYGWLYTATWQFYNA